MCGIVAAVGQNNVIPLLIDGLKKLEYRGYDSTGVGFLQADHHIHCERSLERVAQLEVQTQPFSAHVGIAHTRWPHTAHRRCAMRIRWSRMAKVLTSVWYTMASSKTMKKSKPN